MEFSKILITHGDRWYTPLEGEEVLAEIEFSFFNGQQVLFAARPVELPESMKQYCGLAVHPKDIALV